MIDLQGKFLFKKASSYLHYNQGRLGQKLIADFKYNENIHLGKWIGSYMAKTMLASNFFDGIDFVVPVPLTQKEI